MLPRSVTAGEALSFAQEALGRVSVDDLEQEDAEWVEDAYMRLDSMVVKYE